MRLRVPNREVLFLDESLFRIAFSELNEPVYQVRLSRLKYPTSFPIYLSFYPFYFILFYLFYSSQQRPMSSAA